jgi:DNA invertase Pin-like site-specific DNA recombinase
MTIAAYVRVSSRAQDHATQRDAIERAAAARGEAIGVWYAEKRSAKTLGRPELARLRSDAKAGEVTRLYVFRLDRLARSGIRDTLATLDEFKTAGVKVVTVADGFDVEGPCADVIVSVMAWAAQMERLATAERISAARERIEAEGGTWGRPPVMTPAQVATARRMQADGSTIRAIAQAIGVKKSAVGRALKAHATQPAP